jgi:RecA/RadA recombinase
MTIKKRSKIVADAVSVTVRERASKKEEGAQVNLIPSGSTLLNLSLSDSPYGAYMPGTVVNIVGDSSAGKTFLLWTAFAEIVRHPFFKDYRIIYDEPECAFFMNMDRLFGMPPGRIEMGDPDDNKNPYPSKTAQDFYSNVWRALDRGEPFIYGLDSLDALPSEESLERADKLAKSKEKAESEEESAASKKQKGSFKMEKPKMVSDMLQAISGRLKETGSLLVVISQTRDNINAMAFQKKKTRSGGRALRFYSTHEYWLSVYNHEKRKEREVGVNVIAKVEKNKLTGKLREVGFPIWYDYGVDNINSCIDFLLDEKVWTMSGNKVMTKDLFPDNRRDLLIKHIEENGQESQLIEAVAKAWYDVEESIRTGRKPRYTVDEE